MKTTQSTKSGQAVSLSKSIKFNVLRARARAKVNALLGLCTAGEAGQKIVVSHKSPAWSTGAGWRSFVEYRASGRGADVVTWAAAAAEVAENTRAAQACAARVAAAAAAEVARAAGNGAAIKRLHRLAAIGGAGVELVKGALQVDAKSGAAAMVAAPMAAIGQARLDENGLELGRRAEIARAAAAASRTIGKGWHTEQAKRAQVVYRGLQAEETRARVVAMLRRGLLGRASARAARIGWAMGRRWLRRNSRREALTLAEVGGAAGVDDRKAGIDWAAELQSIAAGVHLRAAAYGVAMVAAPLPACSAIVARGYSGGTVSDLRLAVLGRGRRVDGLPVVSWTSKGRQVAEDSIGIIGRGCAWQWAARQAGRDMHSARYGRGGRDGREVAADWTITGEVAARPFVVAPTRRPSVVQAARDSLAADCWATRRGVTAARAARAAAVTAAEKQETGSELGNALRVHALACKRAEAFGRAMRGQSADCSAFDSWLALGKSGGVVLSAAGRKQAQRMRAEQAKRAADTGAVKVARVALAAGVLVGDEVAQAGTVAPYAAGLSLLA